MPVEAELGLVLFAAARALLHEEAGELAVESLCDIHFRAALEDRLAHRGARGGLDVEGVAQYDGIHLGIHQPFLCGRDGADHQKRKHDIY